VIHFAARQRLATAGDTERVRRLDDFLAFELGYDDEQAFNAQQATAMLDAARDDASMSANKRSMKCFKDLAKDVRYLLPHRRRQCPGLRARSAKNMAADDA
jgi:hypothetical protein